MPDTITDKPIKPIVTFRPKGSKIVLEKKSLAPVDRDFKPESQLGKVMVVTADMKAESVFAFYCDKCKCGLKDS